jgi:hypothetical protein
MFKKGFSKSWKKVLGFLSGKDDVRAGIFFIGAPVFIGENFHFLCAYQSKDIP